MPQIRKYADNAERQAAYNERKREAQREAERKDREAAARIRDIERRVDSQLADWMGQISFSWRPSCSGVDGIREGQDAEVIKLARERCRYWARRMKQGDT